MNRAYIIAILIGSIGLLGMTSSLRALAAALGNRLRRGKPYVVGSIQRALTTMTLTYD